MTIELLAFILMALNLLFCSWNVSKGQYGRATFNFGCFLLMLRFL